MTQVPSANEEVALSHGDFDCLIRPALGGSLWSFNRAGIPVLRDRSSSRFGLVTDSACFPLVPFSNRLRDRGFAFEGRAYRLLPNVPGADRVAHGFGWNAAWWVVRQDSTSVTLRHQHPGEAGWPWPYDADQQIALGPNGLTIDLSVTNRASTLMPAGLGLHPYFPRSGDEQLELMPERVSEPDRDGFPSVDDLPLKESWSIRGAGGPPATAYIDGWCAPALIRRPGDDPIQLLASANARHLVLYAPEGTDYFCVEPVTHAVGALNAPGLPGLVALGPGQTVRLAMTITQHA